MLLSSRFVGASFNYPMAPSIYNLLANFSETSLSINSSKGDGIAIINFPFNYFGLFGIGGSEC